MKNMSKSLRSILSAAVLTAMLYSLPAAANTYTVLNTNDSGTGSLRRMINAANAHVGQDTIAFNIPGAAAHTITVESELPEITDPLIIDGYTQPGSSVNTLKEGDNAVLLIVLNGFSAGQGKTGLHISAGQSVVRGLVINNFLSTPRARSSL